MKVWFTIQCNMHMHPSQGLSFDCVVFDSISVTKHGSTCTTLLKVHSK